MTGAPVFFDPTGRRAGRVARTFWGLFALVVLGLGASLATMLADGGNSALVDRGDPAPEVAVPYGGADARPLTIGFYANWDDNSLPALKHRIGRLDWLVPDWLSLAGPEMSLQTDIDRNVTALVQASAAPPIVLPMLQNFSDGHGWDGPGLARFLADGAARAVRVTDIAAAIAENGFGGVAVDFEEVPPAAHADLRAFLGEMRRAFAPHGWKVALILPLDDPAWDYPAMASAADLLMLTSYEEHPADDVAGALAGGPWFEAALARRMAVLDPARTILAIGSYARDWAATPEAADLSFTQATRAARTQGVAIAFDRASGNPHFGYREDRRLHDVWLLDATTAFNEIRAADAWRPAGYALSRLGTEDPSVWQLLGRPYGTATTDGLATIPMDEEIALDGSGEILEVASEPASGARTLTLDPATGRIADAAYTVLPVPILVQRYGLLRGKIAITFDDGPDPEWTPRILDVLRDKGVPATFFVIGENAGMDPGLVARMVDEGHELGNHTFSHPNIAALPASLAALELNATRRVVEAATGRSLRLFRPPYLGDSEPGTLAEILPVDLAESLGYLTVGLRVDPHDWEKPDPATLVERALAAIGPPEKPNAQVILLHDAGGDRSRTLAALPLLIDRLRAEGFTFVTASTLAGLTRDEAMPPVEPWSLPQVINRPVFAAILAFLRGLDVAFVAALVLGLLKVVLMTALGVANRRRERRTVPPAFDPSVLHSVLIPAFNEAAVIRECVAKVLATRDARIEVIVVDDGSSDGTADVVRQAFDGDPRVRLIRTANGGKARALDIALQHASGPILVALDADTQFTPDTLPRLVRWFADPSVAAVAGNAKVGNRINFLTRCQTLEYITAQNLERRALARLGCVTVVPGAVGAWRRAAVEGLGGFPSDTLAEDQDLTIALQKAGHRVVFDSTAVAWTEAPHGLRGLVRQRFRWAFGTLQCLWKHRDATFRRRHGALGLVALPQAWLFQVVFAVLAPVIDVLLLWGLAGAALDALQHGPEFDAEGLRTTTLFYLLFLTVDFAAGALAFFLERNEPYRLLLWLIPQRFGYRQLMCFVVAKATIVALAGVFVGWGRSERKATVAEPAAAE